MKHNYKIQITIFKYTCFPSFMCELSDFNIKKRFNSALTFQKTNIFQCEKHPILTAEV